MKASSVYNTILLLLNLAMSFPIFIIGAALLWGLGFLMLFGAILILYSVMSCFSIFKIWRHPEQKYLLMEQIAIIVLLVLSLATLAQGVFESAWQFAAGSVIVFGIKLISVTVIYNNRMRDRAIEAS